VKLLLTRGANTNAKNDKGLTPLELAAKRSFKTIVGMLKRHEGKEL